MFDSEKDLVSSFCQFISSEHSPWGTLKYSHEFTHSSGRTDVIATNDDEHLIAFEMKLTNWKKAINQAFRNTSFAQRSYVVLPENAANSAISNKKEFEERSIGLCLVSGSGVEIVFEPLKNEPILPWLNEKAINLIG